MKFSWKMILLQFLASICLSLICVLNVQALVETGWPMGTPNEPRNEDDIFINFEEGIDQIEIESTIPSLQFTTTGGLNWQYADARTGQYNVYPDGQYAINGNVIAWLGVNGDSGRIDFLGGGATYCSVLVSTYSGVVLEAYNSEDELIETSGWAQNNLDTGTFTRLTVDAPEGETISYILIHDTGNYWIMDDLCTDANKAVIPVPGRSVGNHDDKFDIVFIPDEDYGTADDIDTWLPTFLSHINDQIDDRLGGAAPVTGNLSKFNFYYTRMQGTASSKTLPDNLTLLAPFADAFVIFHTGVFGDSCRMTSPSIYGAEGEISAATHDGRSFIHESGHGIFGLADEYDGPTPYFQPDPMPNIWDTEELATQDATSEGWATNNIWEFTSRDGGWWRLDSNDYIMVDGTHFNNGWGEAGERRVQWVLDQFSSNDSAESTMASAEAEAASPTEKSIWMNIYVSNGVFNLIDESLVLDSPPNYLPGNKPFVIKVYSTGGSLLGEFGINDPRIILGEPGYDGPTFLDETSFSMVVPYFNVGGRVDLVDAKTETTVLSVDISQYVSTVDLPPVVSMTSPPPGAAIQDGVTFIATVTDESGIDSITFSIREDDGGNGIDVGFENLIPDYDPGIGIATLVFDTLQLPDGNYLVTISATDDSGNNTTITVPYSIRNWAVVELLPATPENKAGRTMPIKFTLMVSEAVDPSQPFVYNDDLMIKIYDTNDPNNILQTSVFGDKSTDYRIDELQALYITNFKTSKIPEEYTVDICRSTDFLVGSFTFETVKK